MDLESRKQVTETHQTRIILLNDMNDHATVFGGSVLKWMDEVAYITAIRYCRQEMVTISVDKINFSKALPVGTIIELVGRVVEVGNVKVKVKVEIWAETFASDDKQKVIEGYFSFVAIDSNHKPVRLAIPG